MDLPIKAIREQIASAVDLIGPQDRFKDGTRKITAVAEVQGAESVEMLFFAPVVLLAVVCMLFLVVTSSKRRSPRRSPTRSNS